MSAAFGLTDKTLASVRLALSRHPEVQQAILFGSRAKGTHKPGSDIDLALLGDRITRGTLNILAEELDDLPIPYEFSLVLRKEISDPEVIAHIERVGVVFYERVATASPLAC